jgi:hypothetical protein
MIPQQFAAIPAFCCLLKHTMQDVRVSEEAKGILGYWSHEERAHPVTKLDTAWSTAMVQGTATLLQAN